MRLRASLILVVILANACREPFSPEVDPSNRDLFVVEGHLTVGETSTFILSRTGDLQEREARKPEANAKVLIEEGDKVVAQASSDQNGVCTLPTHNLELSKRYRVRIIRANGKVYETDYLENKAAPEIENVYFKVEGKGFKIYLDTHDPTNTTKFYSWNFHETWEIRSPVVSLWELKEQEIVPRDQSINITRCWQENFSSNIMLGSSERLTIDKITQFPLTYVPANSIKLSQLYSILVSQFALTREGYQYLEAMEKNTEAIGTIFDPQPTELRGNIKCVTNPSEIVIGWISAGSVSKKRIFIASRDKLPEWGEYLDVENCVVRVRPNEKVFEALVADSLIENRFISADYTQAPLKFDTTYTMTRRICIDCRLRGSNIKPSYWPN